ncbi:LuxR C-terminal-related transcriptional regulator [Microlunatus ginsengisoli]|uniref:LuxR C-terminal-related transcriptional regulator n=2 Tax=Microlunatus ginsengisoli TaxID=363863 RepID=A0ABP6ZEA2_9ACTN
MSRRALIARPRLIEQLTHAGPLPRLVLVSAPAGAGKTTLLTQWLSLDADPGSRVAWLSLDEADNDLSRFLSDLVGAVKVGVSPAVDDLESLLESGGEPPVDALLTALVNELDEVDGSTVLALDDYHVIDEVRVHHAVGFLLDNLPPRATVAITTRADPPLPLPRLRARGELVELRAADLRFTLGEAEMFLNQVMGLDLDPGQLMSLETRTEGWAAGLQLAGLSLRGRDQTDDFVAAFTGSHRFVLDYLVEEVLDRQPADTQRFLLDTAVLDRMTGPLCDALTGASDGRTMLERLNRSNLFVVALDDRSEWYRYHHLFADALRARLAAEHPERFRSLHRSASRWYARHGLLEDAIAHANAGGDPDAAADLVEQALPEARRLRRDRLLTEWLRMLPDDVIRQRPALSIQRAWMSLIAGDLDGVEGRLRDAEHALAVPAGGRVAPAGDDAVRTLPAWIAIYRASVAQARGDAVATSAYARAALDLAGPDDHFARGGAAGFLGLSAWAEGEVEVAVDTFTQAIASLDAAGNVADALGGTVVLADMWLTRGSPATARRLYEQALATAQNRRGVPLSTAGDLHIGLADVLREHGELEAARTHLAAGRALGEAASVPENRHRWHLARAGLLRALGDLDAAVTDLDEAQAAYVPGFFPDVRPVPALIARLQIARGQLGAAWDWADRGQVGATADLGYLTEFDRLTLARLLIAQNRADGSAPAAPDEVIGLLERVLAEARRHGRGGSVVDAQLLLALAYDARGARELALTWLDRALTAAVPAGYARLFLDEGAPMQVLLRAAGSRPGPGRLAGEVLRAGAAVTSPAPAVAAGADALSERELEVLRLLATPLSGPEISRQLFMTINTFRTHTRHIFTKLNVQTRRAALARAAELDLL